MRVYAVCVCVSIRYSSVRCFAKLVTETNDLAGQRELVAEYWQVCGNVEVYI